MNLNIMFVMVDNFCMFYHIDNTGPSVKTFTNDCELFIKMVLSLLSEYGMTSFLFSQLREIRHEYTAPAC